MSDDLVSVVLSEAGRRWPGRSLTPARSSPRSAPAAPRRRWSRRSAVDYYGSEVPLQQLAGFSVPEARMLVINPYDKASMPAIEKAIRNSDLGLNPSNDGTTSG